jgi:hypothetical protein
MHFRNGQNPNCQGLLHASASSNSTLKPDVTSPSTSTLNCRIPIVPALSQASDLSAPEAPIVTPLGNHFGNYTDYKDIDGEHEEQDLNGGINTPQDTESDEEESEELNACAVQAERERGLELLRRRPAVEVVELDKGEEDPAHLTSRNGVEEPLHCKPFVVKYGGNAGRPVRTGLLTNNDRYGAQFGDPSNVYSPFASALDLEVGK